MQSNINAMTKTGLDQNLTNVIKNDQLTEKEQTDLFLPTRRHTPECADKIGRASHQGVKFFLPANL